MWFVNIVIIGDFREFYKIGTKFDKACRGAYNKSYQRSRKGESMKRIAKKLAIVLVLMLLLSVIPAAVAAESEEAIVPGYLVNLATEEGLKAWEALAEESDGPVHGMIGKVKWELNTEEGYTRFTPTEPVAETDESGDVRVTAEMDFAIKEYRFIAFSYRMSGRMSVNHIYLKDDTDNTEYSGKEHTWLFPQFQADGEWHTMILDIRTSFSGVSGRIKGIRIPVTDTEGSYFDIQYIGAFKTKKNAENFDFETYLQTLAPDETEPAAPQTTEPEPNATEISAPTGSSDGSSKGLIIAVIAIAVAVVAVVAVVIVIVLVKRKK